MLVPNNVTATNSLTLIEPSYRIARVFCKSNDLKTPNKAKVPNVIRIPASYFVGTGFKC